MFAPAGQAGGVLVTVVGVEPLGNETSCHRQDGGAHRRLGRLEVAQCLRRVSPQQPLDLACRFGPPATRRSPRSDDCQVLVQLVGAVESTILPA